MRFLNLPLSLYQQQHYLLITWAPPVIAHCLQYMSKDEESTIFHYLLLTRLKKLLPTLVLLGDKMPFSLSFGLG